jgi:hypothetical protein
LRQCIFLKQHARAESKRFKKVKIAVIDNIRNEAITKAVKFSSASFLQGIFMLIFESWYSLSYSTVDSSKFVELHYSSTYYD